MEPTEMEKPANSDFGDGESPTLHAAPPAGEGAPVTDPGAPPVEPIYSSPLDQFAVLDYEDRIEAKLDAILIAFNNIYQQVQGFMDSPMGQFAAAMMPQEDTPTEELT